MRPVQPNGDTSLPSTGGERDRVSETDAARRLIEGDGLHVSGSHEESRSRSTDGASRERNLLALVSSARHEVRSPLQSIQGFAELLAAESYGTLGSEQRVFVEHMIQSGLDMARALDACFDLVQAELFASREPLGPVPLARALSDALTQARTHTSVTIEESLSQLPPDMLVHTDSVAVSKAVGAIVTALGPLMRGKLLLSAVRREQYVELFFGPALGDARIVWRPLAEVARRTPSARAMLWLQLATVEFERAGGSLQTSEGYDRVRVSLPV